MAESVKRRVAAARLAVAFVAAGTIAGATAWAQPGPPAVTSAEPKHLAKGEHIKKAVLTVRHSDQVVDGTLLFKDFKKKEVPSFKVFQKVELSLKKQIQKVEILFDKHYPKVEIDALFQKHRAESDARYVKVEDSVVRGDGSVFSASKLASPGQTTPLVDVPSSFTVDAIGPTIRITNTGENALMFTACDQGAGAATPGTLAKGDHVDCNATAAAQTMQVIDKSSPKLATISFSALPVQADYQSTVQILIGL
ncbi:MAG: hypothetical protein WD827_03450 [Solirubrobacterales bacterium]